MKELSLSILGVDGSEWLIHGRGSGGSPVRLEEGDVGELFDVPASTIYKGVSGRAGKSFRGHNLLERNIVLTLHIFGHDFDSVYSEFRKALDYEDEAVLVADSPSSGERRLKVRLGEHPQYQGHRDPYSTVGGSYQFVLVAGDPYWHSETVTDEFTFTGSNWVGGGVTVRNPGDVKAWPQWVLTAPARFGLPDFDLRKGVESHIFLPFQPIGRTALVDTDPFEEMITANDGTLLWAKMQGQFFQHPIPPRTGPTELPIIIDPFPGLYLNLPFEFRLWVAQLLDEWAADIGESQFRNLSVQQIANRIREWITGPIPSWVPGVESGVIGRLTSTVIATAIRDHYQSVSHIAGATAQVRVRVRWSHPWGGE